jgi:hypothetical protein
MNKEKAVPQTTGEAASIQDTAASPGKWRQPEFVDTSIVNILRQLNFLWKMG